MALSRPDYPDLSKPIKSNVDDYPDLSQPVKMGEKGELNPNILKRVPHAAMEVASDVGNMALDIPGKLITGLLELPSKTIDVAKQIPDVVTQVATDPKRAAKNVVAGFGDIGHAELNAPKSLADYLVKIGMISKESADKVPFQKEISVDLEGEQPGDKLLRGVAGNLPAILGVGKIASVLNPLKLTNRSLTKNILKTEKELKGEFSGPQGHYPSLFNEATGKGMGGFQTLQPSKLNIATLERYTPDPGRKLESLHIFSKNPTLEAGQDAISELGHIIRPLEKRTSLPPYQKRQLEAAMEARDHIQQSMFTNAQGVLDKDLLSKHVKVQQDYAKKVIPYTTNAAIKAYKRGEIGKAKLIEKLSTGQFIQKRGAAHKPLKVRKYLSDKAGTKFGQGAIFGAGGLSALEIMKSLMGGND